MNVPNFGSALLQPMHNLNEPHFLASQLQTANGNFRNKVNNAHHNGVLTISPASNHQIQQQVISTSQTPTSFKCICCGFTTNSEFVLRSHVAAVHPHIKMVQQHQLIQQQQQQQQQQHQESAAAGDALVIKEEPSASAMQVVTSSNVPLGKQGKNKKKRFQCDRCEFRTSQKQSLTQHTMAVHEKIRPFQCSYESCNYRCARKQNLDKHVMGVHQKIRPFRCHICNNTFSQRVTMNNHIMGVHEKKKPFRCPICDYDCAYQGNLNTHIATVHERRRPHKCDKCGYSCTQKSVLRRHIQAVHDKAHAIPPTSDQQPSLLPIVPAAEQFSYPDGY